MVGVGASGDRYPPAVPRTVYLLSYPRSGSTYLRQLVAELQGRPQLSAYPGDVVLPEGPALTDGLDDVRLVKSHGAAAHSVPAVHLVRDGRDASVSNLFLKELSGRRPRMRRGDLVAGLRHLDEVGEAWPAHTSAVRSLGSGDAVITVRYEDLVADPSATLGRLMARFGGAVAPDELDAAVARVAASRTYEANPLNGHHVHLDPDSLFVPLRAGRGGAHWHDVFDAPARRCFHEQGATPHLLRYGYESSADWWDV